MFKITILGVVLLTAGLCHWWQQYQYNFITGQLQVLRQQVIDWQERQGGLTNLLKEVVARLFLLPPTPSCEQQLFEDDGNSLWHGMPVLGLLLQHKKHVRQVEGLRSFLQQVSVVPDRYTGEHTCPWETIILIMAGLLLLTYQAAPSLIMMVRLDAAGPCEEWQVEEPPWEDGQVEKPPCDDGQVEKPPCEDREDKIPGEKSEGMTSPSPQSQENTEDINIELISDRWKPWFHSLVNIDWYLTVPIARKFLEKSIVRRGPGHGVEVSVMLEEDRVQVSGSIAEDVTECRLEIKRYLLTMPHIVVVTEGVNCDLDQDPLTPDRIPSPPHKPWPYPSLESLYKKMGKEWKGDSALGKGYDDESAGNSGSGREGLGFVPKKGKGYSGPEITWGENGEEGQVWEDKGQAVAETEREKSSEPFFSKKSKRGRGKGRRRRLPWFGGDWV